MSHINSLDNGYAVVQAEEFRALDELRREVYNQTKSIFSLHDKDPETGFNNLHKSISDLSPGEFNSRRVELIDKLTNECDASEMVFKAFERQILSLIGPDILAQKTCNLVIQPPRDPNPSEIHRDAPLNSPYEVVVWVPLVDCFSTKSMYILDEESTKKAFSFLDSNPTDWLGFENYARSLAVNPSVPFGSALFFHTGMLHGSDINTENETRISLNIRYKNIFSPAGLKNQLQFFKILRSSPFTRMGARFETRELLR
jgi:sporadic carbohydrate cluster 2OG-Fe(II) oxygenase